MTIKITFSNWRDHLPKATPWIILVAISVSSCAQHSVGNKSVHEVFNDAALARLAHQACVGDVDGVRASLRAEVDPNGEGQQGVTPLFWAITCKNLDGVEALLMGGADPNLLYGGKFSATFQASSYVEDPELLRALLRSGGNPNSRYAGSQQTALTEALDYGARTGRWENWRTLLDAGADINAADSGGGTIAIRAVALGEFDRVDELLSRGYNYDLRGLQRALEIRIIDPSNTSAASKRDELLRALSQRGSVSPSLVIR